LLDVAGFLADGSLIWPVTALTTVKLNAKTTNGEITTPGISGSINREVGLEVVHAFRRWLNATLNVTVGNDTYTGTPRHDEHYATSLKFAYALNPTVQVKTEFRKEWHYSNAPGLNYSASTVLLRLRLQR
jgi:hypothetical protein